MLIRSRNLLTVFRQERNWFTTFKPATRNSRRGVPTFVFQFEEEVHKALVEVHDAVQGMIPLNAGFSTSYGVDVGLVINTERGKYTFRGDRERNAILLQSFFSGFHAYKFDEEQRLWLSERDGHDMRGLVTRDLLRHCSGCPSFK